MSLSEKHSVRSDSHVSSSVSLKSDQSKDYPPDFSERKPSSDKSVRSDSHVSSSMSLKSDQSKDDPLNFSERKSDKSLQYETLDSDVQTHRKHESFKDNLLWIFQDLESKLITFLKKELEKFKKILQNENTEFFVKDFNENRCSTKAAALDLTLHYLREMKQDEAADALEDELLFIHQLKCGLKKKYQCVFEGIAKQGDSTLLNNIYTDLYITQGGSEQVNTEHEVRQIEVASRHHESQEIQVECRNLFEAPEQDKDIRTVLTKGVAGIGKSVSVQKFVLDWAEGKQNQDISFIFPLPFREMNLKEKEKLSLMDLITHFFPETKGLNLTRRNQFKVLFILDGLDECRLPLKFDRNETWHDVSSPASLDVLLTNLMKGNLLPSALIWITTRPAAASKIPPDCIDRLTEIRGFNDAQKEEYFKKRFTDQNQANTIIDHVKKSKSLFIMCHIPVFCWISATVLQNILEEKRNNDVKINQADEISKTQQESNTEDTPKTLTQMYTHFLRFQIQQSRRKYDGEYAADVSWDKDAILSLGKLAFHQLERNNVIFYNSDLEACGIDVYKASVYSGMCTQIFKEETGITLGTMYCFVHLSIQEFIAALYAHLFLDINKKSVFVHESTEQENKNETLIDFLKTAVDKALESDSGHLDLFLRFLLGLSLQSNRRLLRGLLSQQDDNEQSNKRIVQYIKQKLEDNLPAERSINLFYCLNELNDQTLVKEIQTQLNKQSLSSGDLSPAQWSALVFVLLTSEEDLEEFELQKFKKSDECVIRLSAVIKTSRRALLDGCNLTDKSCSALAAVLGSDTNLKELNMNNNNLHDSGLKLLCGGLKNIKCRLEILRCCGCSITEKQCLILTSALKSNPSHLRELNLSWNKLENTGVKHLCDVLKDSHGKLERLRLSNCSVTEEGYKALASALRSNPSHLIELDLTGNDPGESGVKELDDLLQDPNCQLKTLRFVSPAADEACQYVRGIVGKNPLLLRELNLSEHELGDTRVNQMAELLKDKHCRLNTLTLNRCSITEKQCLILTSALKSNPSHLRELNLSWNKLENTGVKHLCDVLKDSHGKLERLRLSNCSVTEEGYKALASALRSNPSHLIELDLTGNDPGESGVKELDDLLQDPNCQLKTLRFVSPAADEACQYVSGIVGKNPLLLRELNLSEHELGDTRVNQMAELLQDKHCRLNTLTLNRCSITEKQCLILTSALKSNPSHLRELNLSWNKLENTGVKHLCDVLKDSHGKMERLRLSNCSVTEEGYKALASALRSNPSHLIELDLTGNDPGESGVKELNDLLQNPNCQLKTLRFVSPAADEACQYVRGIVGKNPLLLRELNLSEHELGDTQVNQMAELLQDKHCRLNTLTLNRCSITEKQCLILTSALKLNPSHLRELDLSRNKIENKGMNHLCDVLKDSHCNLERLRLIRCDMTDEGCSDVTSALKLNSSHLRELDLTWNKLGNSAVKNLSDLLMDPQCKLEKLNLCECSITEKQCVILTSALKSNPSHLRELDLSRNKLGDSGLKNLSDLLMNPQCKLEKLPLCQCSITEKQCLILASALKSNPSHLRELDLSENQITNTGLKHICDILKDSHCKLERLSLMNCGISDVSSLTESLTNTKALQFLKELNLINNKIRDSKQLRDVIQDSNCKLRDDREQSPDVYDRDQSPKHSDGCFIS
ncbi:NACHT, LRR and PYD domains-containing protein 12-like [Megalobrama amblycephala]|uniref:NACHT, LRR and PYD domains-containing protein 12-like n=1 Tax=Megalobrama amblycephala TaxID=75352 RepID=UPI002014769A|nr:NACHT, LRR and PYD domains-containing protein 12-like [Megalobrama amblycephala]